MSQVRPPRPPTAPAEGGVPVPVVHPPTQVHGVLEGPGGSKNARGRGAAVTPGPDPGCGSRAGLGDEGGGGPWARPTPLALATCQETRRGGRGPFKTRARHPLPPSPGERRAENNGEPMGGRAARGAKGGRPVALPWGRPQGRAGAGGAIFQDPSPAAPPPQQPERSPSPLPAKGCGMRREVPGCAALQARPRAPQGSRHRAGEAGSRIAFASRPAGNNPPPPGQTSPKRARASRRSRGWGPWAPRALTASPRFCLLLRLTLQHRRLLGSPRSGREPRSRLRALSLPGRAAGRWALRARTDYPTDRRTREPAAGRRDPAGGRRPSLRSGEGRGRGRRRRKGRRQIAALSTAGADTRVLGRPVSWARPTWDPRRLPDPSRIQAMEWGVHLVTCLNLNHFYVPVAQSRAWYTIDAQ